MKCRFCGRTSEPYVVNYPFDGDLIYTEIKCSKCLMIQETKWSDSRKERNWESVGEIIKLRTSLKSNGKI